MSQTTTFAIIAVVAAFGLLGIAVIESINLPHQVQAAKSLTGQCASSLKNASAQFCHTLR